MLQLSSALGVESDVSNQPTMKKLILSIVSISALALLSQSAQAKPQKEEIPGFGGKVTAVSADSITVTSKNNGEKTFKTDATTKVCKSDASAAALADIKVGTLVKVAPGTAPDQAASITVLPPKAGKADGEGKGGKKKEHKNSDAGNSADKTESAKDAPATATPATPAE